VNTERSPRGVIIKLLGAIMMMLGLLDCVLTLRGGVPAYEFLLLVFFGAGVFAIGAVRAGSRGTEENSPAPANESQSSDAQHQNS
jgi:hypothetical protein